MGKPVVLCVVGTRPEAVKMSPVVRALRTVTDFDTQLLSTAQHRHMVDPALAFFGLKPDYDLDAMTENQTLSSLTSRLLDRFAEFLTRARPALVIGQGDTTTVMVAALACFYAGVPFAHVEAGLRTGDMRQPFPEEFNRVAVSRIASMHFAPTTAARDCLLREGVPAASIFLTGNTVVDALLWTVARHPAAPVRFPSGARVMLVTLHRRENFGAPMRSLLDAIVTLLAANPRLHVVLPVHPNPAVRSVVIGALGDHPRVSLTAPLEYPEFVALLQRCDFVLTDSGGVQEEAPSIGKPVLVARRATERPEAVDAGLACLVGTDRDEVIARCQELLDDPAVYARMSHGVSPYGDGAAGERIRSAVVDWMSRRETTIAAAN